MRTRGDDNLIHPVEFDVYAIITHPMNEGALVMSESLGLVAVAAGFLVGWIVLNKWVLPRFGVKT
jgi:hypothetical protein